jgi:Holliday junction resolvase
MESTIVTSILKYLNGIEGCYAIKKQGTQNQGGQPDIFGCFDGRMLALEVKRPGETPTKLQRARLKRWAKAGAIAAVVCSRDQVKELLLEEVYKQLEEEEKSNA